MDFLHSIGKCALLCFHLILLILPHACTVSLFHLFSSSTFCRHCSAAKIYTFFNYQPCSIRLHLTLACTFTISLQWFKHLFVEYKYEYVVRGTTEMNACTIFCISPEPIFSLHFSNQLYMFNFCALRFYAGNFFLVAFVGFYLFVDHACCLFAFCSLLLSSAALLLHFHFSLSSCLLIATDLCTLWFFKWAMKKKLMRKCFANELRVYNVRHHLSFFILKNQMLRLVLRSSFELRASTHVCLVILACFIIFCMDE